MSKEPLYKVVFVQRDEVLELYARYITEDSLVGFVEVEELVFSDPDTELVINPNLEKLKLVFQGVQRTYLPLHTILRIDEIDQPSVAAVVHADKPKPSNVTPIGGDKETGRRE
jgi:hypothetical protein